MRQPKVDKPADTFDKIYKAIADIFDEPIVLLFVLIAAYLVVTHARDPATSAILTWADKLEANNNTKTVGIWMRNNAQRVVGLAVFVPVVVSFKSDRKIFVTVCAAAWVLLVPVHTVYQYAIQAILFRTYLRLKDSTARMYVLALGLGLWWFGYVTHLTIN